MKRAPIVAMAIVLTACPPSPRDEETDSGADLGTEDGPSPTSSSPEPETTSSATSSTETGSPEATTCEEELAEVKAALAECLGK